MARDPWVKSSGAGCGRGLSGHFRRGEPGYWEAARKDWAFGIVCGIQGGLRAWHQ